MEEAGVLAPSQSDKMIAIRVCAYGNGNLEGFISADKVLERLKSKNSAKRKRKKPHSKEIANY